MVVAASAWVLSLRSALRDPLRLLRSSGLPPLGAHRLDDLGYSPLLEFLCEGLVETGAELGRRDVTREDLLRLLLDVHAGLGGPEGPIRVAEVALVRRLAQGDELPPHSAVHARGEVRRTERQDRKST